MTRPNLFIVGAPKCGTTSLFHYLECHPQVYFSTPKEVNYFSKNELESQGLYYKDYKPSNESEYLKIFERARADQKIVGEASVSYLFYPEASRKIYAFNPDAKIIILLRDPVKRAWSHYLMDKRIGLVDRDFMDIFKNKADDLSLHYQQYFLLGDYYTQIKRYIDVFGTQNVFIGFTSELKTRPREMMSDILTFLNIDQIDIDTSTNHNGFKDTNFGLIKSLYKNHLIRTGLSKVLPTKIKNKVQDKFFTAKSPQMTEQVESILRDYYRNEVCKLEKLINVNLEKWK